MSLMSAIPHPKRSRTGFEKVALKRRPSDARARGTQCFCASLCRRKPASGYYEVKYERPRQYDVVWWAPVFSIFAI
jgi:hypothetical protein